MIKNKFRQVIGLILLIFLLTACGQSQKAATMYLMKTEGSVSVADSEGKSMDLVSRMGLYSGYRLATEIESYAWIDLDSTKLAKMDAATNVEIQKEDGMLEILVGRGSVFFHVTEPLSDDETMNIRTSTLTVGIRGTCGWITIMDEGHIQVCLLEGTVECVSTLGKSFGQVTAGEKADFMLQSGQGQVEKEPLTAEDIPAYAVPELSQELTQTVETAQEEETQQIEETDLETDSESASAESSDEETPDEAQEMKIAPERVEYLELSGGYTSSSGQSAMDLLMYTWTENEELGTAAVYAASDGTDGAYHETYEEIYYEGTIVESEQNLYRVVTNTEDEVLLAVSESDSDVEIPVYVGDELLETRTGKGIVIQLFVNGQYVDEYSQVTRWTS